MSKEKMSKVLIEKKVKLNLNYLDFISKVISEKLLSKNKEELVSNYLNIVKVRSYKNINRVDSRVKREKLNSLLISELEKRNIKIEDFNKVSEKVVNKLSEKDRNFIEI